LQQIAVANKRSRVVLRAAGVATFNGWTIGLCAALCLPFVYWDIRTLLIVACLAVVAYVELRGARLLRVYDPRGPRLLGFNQLVLLALIVAYCSWNLYRGLTGPDLGEELMSEHPELGTMLEAASDPSLTSVVGSIGEIHRSLVVLIYVTVIVVSFIFQGLCSLYYFSRQKHLRAFVEQTPSWVLDVQRQQ
jgi:hypothetical protein